MSATAGQEYAIPVGSRVKVTSPLIEDGRSSQRLGQVGTVVNNDGTNPIAAALLGVPVDTEAFGVEFEDGERIAILTPEVEVLA